MYGMFPGSRGPGRHSCAIFMPNFNQSLSDSTIRVDFLIHSFVYLSAC